MPSTHARHRDAIKACLVGFKEKDATSWEAKSYGREKGVFEARVNEVLSPVWGEEERMSERLPTCEADGSFDSKDKCFITAGSTCGSRTLPGANQPIQSRCTPD